MLEALKQLRELSEEVSWELGFGCRGEDSLRTDVRRKGRAIAGTSGKLWKCRVPVHSRRSSDQRLGRQMSRLAVWDAFCNSCFFPQDTFMLF